MSRAFRPPTMATILVAGLGSSACTLLPPESAPRTPFPNRGIAPWICGEISVCRAGVCDDDLEAEPESADLYWENGALRVLVELGGAIYGGMLATDTAIELDPRPLIVPALPWQGEGLRDPDWVETESGGLILFSTADGSAVGAAALAGGVLTVMETPLWRAVDLGRTRVDGPSAIWHGGDLFVALALDHSEIHVASGPALDALAPPAPAFTTAAASGAGWSELTRLDGPELRVTVDDQLGLFFSATASGPPAGENAPRHESIGYAGSTDGGVWEMFAGNPVLDCTVSFILHGDEAAPALAEGDPAPRLLYRATTSAGRRLGLATPPR